jgi:hypothetical protein
MRHNRLFGSFGLTCCLSKENNSRVETTPQEMDFGNEKQKWLCTDLINFGSLDGYGSR